MIRFLLLAILFLLIARLFWRVIDNLMTAAGIGEGRRGRRPPARAVKLQRDPVCGTFVAPETALPLTSGNTTFYFCSEDCRAKFQTR